MTPSTPSDWALLAPIILGFALMARGRSQAIVMPLVATTLLFIKGPHAPAILQASFAGFAVVAITFSAIAIPAHQLRCAGLFRRSGAALGSSVGWIGLRFPRARVAAIVFLSLFLTWLLAALFHNITSIMVMTPVLIAVAEAYGLPSRWLLCGALIASNLGGFSTRWGDTPNIVQAGIWDLSHVDFFTEIMPLNLLVLACLAAGVTVLTVRAAAAADTSVSDEQTALQLVRFRMEAAEFRLDRRLLAVGLITLAGFITIQFVDRELEIAAGAAAILFAVVADRPEDREKTLGALDLQVFQVLLSVFVIAHCLRESAVGAGLEAMIAATGGAPWAIALAGYFGTALSEAASWAVAAAPVTHTINPSHAGAWALGAGIFAGSSALLTAASAGIILWSESRRFPGHAVTFGSYFGFGLVASALMLVFYIAVISMAAAAGGYGP